MALTIIQRPQGHNIGTTEFTATTTSPYGTGDAYFVDAAHGLVDGDFIYAVSDIEEYNGFWYVDQVNTDGFKLKASADATDYLQFIADGSITYYVSQFSHGWSCVHLPIVYKLQSNLFPNTVDAERTITVHGESNGYTELETSGDIKTPLEVYHYIKISGSPDPLLNGVYQVIDVLTNDNFIIDLAFNSGNSANLLNATIQFYYNNYHARIKVYGGLASDHQWEHLKPFVELAELKIIPDEDGVVMFSVHEILKSQIKTKNNLLLATLPLNLDFFTQFYISYAESYDNSTGSEVTTFVSSYTSDASVDDWTSVPIDALNLWLENGTGNEWTDTTTPTVTLTDDEDSEVKYTNETLTEGETYRITYSFGFNTTASSTPIYTLSVRIRIKDSSDNVLLSESVSLLVSPTTGTYEFTAPANASRIAIDVIQNTISGSVTNDITINSISLDINERSGFTGYAANAKLEFKNPYSGYLTNYIDNAWLTLFAEPVIFDDHFFDLSAIVNESGDIDVIVNGDLSTTYENASPGIYRIPITPTGEDMTVKLQISGEDITDEITLRAFNACEHENIYLSWLNNLGGFDYWNFTAKKDHMVDIRETGEMRNNIFPTWPNSYATQADTIRRQTYRVSNKSLIVRSQHLTRAQADAISYIKSSVLVQIVNSRQDRRTVIVDADSFTKYRDRDDTYSISFTIQYTDDIPSQTI